MVTKAPLNKARASLALRPFPADLLTISRQDLSRSLHNVLKDKIEKPTAELSPYHRLLAIIWKHLSGHL